MRAYFAVVTILAATSLLRCQTPIWSRTGYGTATGGAILGGPLAVIGDVDGDGFEDVLQSVYGSLPPQGLWIFSGRDGATLRMQPPFLPYAVRTIARTGDMNGDGIGDYALGWLSSLTGIDIVQVRSASDDSLLWQATGSYLDMFGFHLAGDLDTNGDGLRDLVVSAERENSWTGVIRVYGNNGALRYTIANQPGLFSLGFSLAAVGDVNGDGCDDFAAGAVDTLGMVVVFSGLTGAELRRGYGDIDGVLGYSVTGCGDMNGDGVPDFAGGTQGGFGDRGMVRVFSGADASTLYTWWSPSVVQYGNGFGREIFGGHDVDRDGVPDLVVCNADYTPSQYGSAVAAYSGRDGSRLFRLVLPAPGFLSAFTRPEPGDVFARFVANHFSVPVQGFEVTTMYDVAPPGVESFGVPCAGTSSRAPKIGIHGINQITTRLHLSDGEPGALGILMLGLSSTNFLGFPLPWPLSGHGFAGCMLSTSIDAVAIVGLGTTGTAAGYAAFDLALPLAATGLAVHGQWLSLHATTAAPAGVSDALRWRF